MKKTFLEEKGITIKKADGIMNPKTVNLTTSGLRYLLNCNNFGIIKKINLSTIRELQKLKKELNDKERDCIISINNLSVYGGSIYEFLSIYLAKTPIQYVRHSDPEISVRAKKINLNFLKSNFLLDYDIILNLTDKEYAKLNNDKILEIYIETRKHHYKK